MDIFGFEGRVGTGSGTASVHCQQILFESVRVVISFSSEFLYFVSKYKQDVVELFFISAVAVDSMQ